MKNVVFKKYLQLFLNLKFENENYLGALVFKYKLKDPT
jgi:hypothetical protein